MIVMMPSGSRSASVNSSEVQAEALKERSDRFARFPPFSVAFRIKRGDFVVPDATGPEIRVNPEAFPTIKMTVGCPCHRL